MFETAKKKLVKNECLKEFSYFIDLAAKFLNDMKDNLYILMKPILFLLVLFYDLVFFSYLVLFPF